MKITKQWLITAHACHSQVKIFDEEWPDGAEITLENYLRAAELNLDLGWFAKNIFSAPAQKAYDEAMAIAQKAYDIAMAQAQKVYDIAMAQAQHLWLSTKNMELRILVCEKIKKRRRKK